MDLFTDKENEFIRGFVRFNNWDCDIDREIFEESYGPYWRYYNRLRREETQYKIIMTILGDNGD